MYYVLHHSKGTLTLSAQDRQQVQEWSKRQLGGGAGSFSILESEREMTDTTVERSGTGILTSEEYGCRPLAGFSNQAAGTEPNIAEAHLMLRPSARRPTWH